MLLKKITENIETKIEKDKILKSNTAFIHSTPLYVQTIDDYIKSSDFSKINRDSARFMICDEVRCILEASNEKEDMMKIISSIENNKITLLISDQNPALVFSWNIEVGI